MKRSTTLAAIAVAVVTAALTAQAGAVPGPVAQQETPDDGTVTPDDGTPTETTPENETPDDETPTETTPEPVTPDDETPENETPGDETPTDGVDNATTDGVDNATNETPSVTFEDQESDGLTVTVSNATLTQAGYVVIHDDTLAEGQVLDSVIGVSDYLPAGTYDNVTVELFDVPGATYGPNGTQTANVTNATVEPQLNGTQELTAMLHAENSDGEVFDYVETVGLLDVPVEINDTAVTDTANVTVVDGTATNETADNETDTPFTGNETETDTPTLGTETETETDTPSIGNETETDAVDDETETPTGTPGV